MEIKVLKGSTIGFLVNIDCGAGSKGGGGFRKGNTCGKGALGGSPITFGAGYTDPLPDRVWVQLKSGYSMDFKTKSGQTIHMKASHRSEIKGLKMLEVGVWDAKGGSETPIKVSLEVTRTITSAVAAVINREKPTVVVFEAGKAPYLYEQIARAISKQSTGYSSAVLTMRRHPTSKSVSDTFVVAKKQLLKQTLKKIAASKMDNPPFTFDELKWML